MHQLFGLFIQLGAFFIASRELERFLDDLLDRLARIQRGIRILKDDLHLFIDLVHLFSIYTRDIFAVQENLTIRAFQQMDDGAPQRALAASGFADHAHRLAFADFEGDIVHRMEQPFGRIEILFEVLDLDHGRFHHFPSFASSLTRQHRHR